MYSKVVRGFRDSAEFIGFMMLIGTNITMMTVRSVMTFLAHSVIRQKPASSIPKKIVSQGMDVISP
jgi:hypothetical protein